MNPLFSAGAFCYTPTSTITHLNLSGSLQTSPGALEAQVFPPAPAPPPPSPNGQQRSLLTSKALIRTTLVRRYVFSRSGTLTCPLVGMGDEGFGLPGDTSYVYTYARRFSPSCFNLIATRAEPAQVSTGLRTWQSLQSISEPSTCEWLRAKADIHSNKSLIFSFRYPESWGVSPSVRI